MNVKSCGQTGSSASSGSARAKKWVTRMTATLSTSWLTSVEPLLRSQRCRPRVSSFQKWKSCTSTNCATR